MAAKKPTAKAAAKQPEAKTPATKPEESKVQDSAQPAAENAVPSAADTEAQAAGTSEAGQDSSNTPATGEKSVTAPGAPETKPAEPGDQSKEPGAAKEGTSSDEVELEVVTRLERRIRGGVVVTKEPRVVRVSVATAEKLAADPHISVKKA